MTISIAFLCIYLKRSQLILQPAHLNGICSEDNKQDSIVRL